MEAAAIREVYQKTESVLWMFIKGEDVPATGRGRNITASAIELFPIPWDKTAHEEAEKARGRTGKRGRKAKISVEANAALVEV